MLQELGKQEFRTKNCSKNIK